MADVTCRNGSPNRLPASCASGAPAASTRHPKSAAILMRGILRAAAAPAPPCAARPGIGWRHARPSLSHPAVSLLLLRLAVQGRDARQRHREGGGLALEP